MTFTIPTVRFIAVASRARSTLGRLWRPRVNDARLSWAWTHLTRNAQSFAFKVRGDSMNGAGNLVGDHVIMEFRDPKHGDIVAAFIDGETSLKRYLTS